MKKNHRPGELDALYFDKLPQRCKEMYFEFMKRPDVSERTKARFCDIVDFDYRDCESPIEIILDFAFNIMTLGCPGLEGYLYLIPQYEIETNKKKYRVDLIFDTNECESPYVHFEKKYKLAIECDGHDFHEKTKAQVEKDNERDFNLKMAGYDIIHFSGSQIFNEPFECAKNIIRLIMKNVGGNNEQGMDLSS